MKKENRLVLAAGVAVGLAALALTALGNPGSMGFCIACFERDIAGAVGLHSAAKVQYAEAFEICEYGRQPAEAEIRALFPFFP